MLKVFYGNDLVGVRAAALAAAQEFTNNESTITNIDVKEYEIGLIISAVGTTSLFGGIEVFIIDTPNEGVEFEEEVKNNLKEMAESSNIFIIVEKTLLAGPKKEYEKYAETLKEFKSVNIERFNTFSMADALANKDKRKLWLLLQDAKAAGFSEEEIIGVLWWQLKSLRLAAITNFSNEAGMKDFPYNKAKYSLTNFKAGEIEELSRSLLTVYHDGHGGIKDIDGALEKWTLSI